MSDDTCITPAEVRPGMHVEIMQRPWRGVVRSPLAQGRFFAEADDADPLGFETTSWSVDAIGSIRLLPDPLPTQPGTWFRATVHGVDGPCVVCVTPFVINGLPKYNATAPDGRQVGPIFGDQIDADTVRLVTMEDAR